MIHATTRDRLHETNQGSISSTGVQQASRKIGRLEIVKKINPNAYRLHLPSHIRTADVFNVKLLVPYIGDNSSGEKLIPIRGREEWCRRSCNDIFLDKHA